MSDFWAFRTMITPVIIQIIFWLGTLICLSIGIGMILMGVSSHHPGMGHYIWKGILLVIFGPLGVRVYCEILIVFFRINETLTEIKHDLDRRPQG
jgi:hypothetical protein